MPAPSQLQHLLSLIGRTDDVRLGFGTSGFDTQLVAREVVDTVVNTLAEQDVNVWFEVQGSNYTRPRGRSKASDIRGLWAIYADIDYKDTGVGSEPAARDLIDDLSGALGVPPVAIVRSGHGLQPYWPIENGLIDEDGIDRSADHMARLLKRWGLLVVHLASAMGGQLDSVYDLPRILRVPGPDNVKDPAHPQPTALEVIDGNVPLTPEELDEILNDHGIDMLDNLEISAEVVAPSADWNWAESDCDFVGMALREIASSNPASRHHWALKYAAIIHGMIRGECVTQEGFVRLRDALTERFVWLGEHQEPVRPVSDKEIREVMQYGLGMAQKWSKAKLGTELRGHVHRDFEAELTAGTPRLATVSNMQTRQVVEPRKPGEPGAPMFDGNLAVAIATDDSISLDRKKQAFGTETGNAEYLRDAFGQDFINIPSLGWYRWNGMKFVPDDGKRAVEIAKDVFVGMMGSNLNYVAEWGKKSLSKAKLESSIALTGTIPGIQVRAIELNARGTELATPDGIVDLATGILRPADPTYDRVTQCTAVAPDPSLQMPMFLGFLQWAMSGDIDRVEYLQRLFGAALIGEVRWHIFPIMLGPGANGKTTLLDIIAGVMGDYAAYMPRKFLVAGTDPHPEVIARLQGVRFAIASEVPPTAAFEEDLVKQIAGETHLTGRFMNQNSFTFKNQVTMMLAANHLPTVRSGGPGFWRRVRRLDFRAQIDPGRTNERLVQQILAAEAPAILAWMIAGAVQILRTGSLDEPASVLASTKQYQREEDTLFRFLEETVAFEDDTAHVIDRDILYQRYRTWSYANGVSVLSSIKFARDLALQYARADAAGKTVFAGMRLRVGGYQFAHEDPITEALDR